MAKAKPPAKPESGQEHDPFAIRNIEQLFTLFDGGDFLARFMADHRDLMCQMQEHNQEFGHKGAKGSFTINVAYELGASGDLGMSATLDFKGPKKPSSKAHAFVDHQGHLTLHSPMMKRMHGGVRDVTEYDPEIGEIKDV